LLVHSFFSLVTCPARSLFASGKTPNALQLIV
jgi:hypothetical protein